MLRSVWSRSRSPPSTRWRRDRRREHRRCGAGGPSHRLSGLCPAVPGEALMSDASWAQLVVLIALIGVTTPLLGSYMAKVYGGKKAPGDRVFGSVERVVY